MTLAYGSVFLAIIGGFIEALLLAMVLILYARSLRPTPEVEMVREVRNMALSDIEEEIALVEAEIGAGFVSRISCTILWTCCCQARLARC